MDFGKLFAKSIMQDMTEDGDFGKEALDDFRKCKTVKDVWEFYKKISTIESLMKNVRNSDNPEERDRADEIEDFLKNLFYAGFHLSMTVYRDRALKAVHEASRSLSNEILDDRMEAAFKAMEKKNKS